MASEETTKTEGTDRAPSESPKLSRPVQVGERAGAILKADKNKVMLLGYGVYDGPQSLPAELAFYEGHKNPRITLDNGNVVWGVQCWWGSEEAIQNSIRGREVVICNTEEKPW